MSYIGILAATFIFLGIIVADIFCILVWIVKWITCQNISDCKNRKCHINNICPKYNPKLTKEEYEYLKNLIKRTFKDER